jgi:hypothetical protein
MTLKDERITKRQIVALKHLATSFGWSQLTLDNYCLDTYGALAQGITKLEASEIIKGLHEGTIEQ